MMNRLVESIRINATSLAPMVMGLAALSVGVPTHAADVLIKAGRIETMTGPAIENGQILVSDGKIKAVGTDIDAPEGAEVKELGPESVIMPGLIDADAPIIVSGAASEYTRELTPNFRVESVIDWKSRSFAEALAEGTTAVGMLPASDNVIAGLGCVVRTTGSPGERVLLSDSALMMCVCSDPSSRNLSRNRPDSIFVRQPTNRMGVVSQLRATLAAARDASLEYGPPLDGQAPVPLAELRASLDGERPIYVLSRTAFDIEAAQRIGEEFGFTFVILGGQEAHMMADQLVASKQAVILGPLSPVATRGPEGTELHWNVAGVLDKAGVPIALSGGSILEQARFAHRFGLPREAAYRAVTQTPAKLLGVDDRIGTIEPGKDADVVAFGGDPLEFTTPIRWVMVAGTIQPGFQEPARED